MSNISFATLTPDAITFLSERTGIAYGNEDMRHWFCATAYDDSDTIVAVLACEPKTWFDWHFSCAIDDPACMSRRLLKTIFRTLFTRAVRVTALVSPDNERALDQVRRMGFVYEGFIRLGVEGTRDAMMFGMLRSDCRFLPGYQPAVVHKPPARGRRHGLHS